MNTKHLKAKILDLAIRGKLVPQDSSEGNAADLLQKIREEKNKCHPELDSGSKQKKLKEDTKTAKSAASFIIKADDGKHYEQFTDGSLKDIEDEIPFEIPENWCWTKIKTVSAEILYGVSESAKTEGKYKLLRITDIQNNRVNWDKVPLTNYDETSVPQYLLKPGDLVFARTGATVGKSYLIEDKIENAIYASYLIRVRPSQLIDSKYIKYYFQSRPYWDQIIDRSLGNGQPNVNGTSLANLFIPLPPLSEQQRIVTAIEKAFEQIDIIEKNKLNLKTYIKQTKSKVLDLAIHGKLVEQNPQEGNAADLLQKIREEKASHGLDFANAKSKKNKQQPETALAVSNPCDISDNEIPFEIPENWCWCRGKSVFLPMTSRLPSGDEFKYIDIETVDNKLHKVHHPKIIKTENAPSRASRETLVGDTVFSMVRPYLTNIALITEGLSDCIASTGFYICRPNKALNSVYLYYLMISDYVVNGLNQFMKGDNSPSINGDDITEFYYPLPPLSEQKRIVAKIEQVFEQLDVLEKSMGEYKIIEE